MLLIQSNGSKFGGEQPDTIDQLLDILQHHPLDRVFEGFGNFIVNNGHIVTFLGNFHDVSHIFNIVTDEKDVIKKLTDAIRENQKRPDYLAQPEYTAKL